MRQWQADTAESSRHIGLEAAAPIDKGSATENSDCREDRSELIASGARMRDRHDIFSDQPTPRKWQIPAASARVARENELSEWRDRLSVWLVRKGGASFQVGMASPRADYLLHFLIVYDTGPEMKFRDGRCSEERTPSQARTGSNASRIDLASTDNTIVPELSTSGFEKNPFQFNSFGGLWQVCCDLDELWRVSCISLEHLGY